MKMTKPFRPLVVLLLLVNALLLSLVGYEVVAIQRQPQALGDGGAPPATPRAVAKSTSHLPRNIDDYVEVVNRPLFNRERRPIEQEAVAESEEESLTFSLVGVVLTPEQQVAIIYSKKQKQPLKVALWEWIEGWRLVSVAATKVELRKGQRSVELTLQRASQPGTN